MRAFIDTNVIIDVLAEKEPHFTQSYLVLRNLIENGEVPFVSTTAITDIFYIISGSIGKSAAKEKVAALLDLVQVVDVGASDIDAALSSSIDDLEDAVVSTIAKRVAADCIVTRNERDFKKSSVRAISPKSFNKEWGISA